MLTRSPRTTSGAMGIRGPVCSPGRQPPNQTQAADSGAAVEAGRNVAQFHAMTAGWNRHGREGKVDLAHIDGDAVHRRATSPEIRLTEIHVTRNRGIDVGDNLAIRAILGNNSDASP